MDSRRDAKRRNVATFIPLSKPDLTGNELKYVTEAIKSGWITHKGKFVSRFEEDFSKFTGSESISCSSGTAALHLALLASGVGPGDEVIVPDLTFANTASVVKHVGAVPILVDVGKDFCIDPIKIEDAVTVNTKAIIPVHLYGMECDMQAIMKIADKYRLIVIEDACESLWVKPTAHFTAYSFYGNKTMTTGEGGMLCGKLNTAKLYRDGGFDAEYNHSVAGLNYRMTNIQAAIGCAQLERVNDFMDKTLLNAFNYKGRLYGKGRWLFVAEVSNPKEMKKNLDGYGIESRPVFWPLHLMKPYKTEGDFPNTVSEWKTGICLPTGPHVTEKDIDFVCEKLEQFTEERFIECR